MANPDIAIVILAAGKGTRLKSALAKVLHRAGGRPLVEHVARACQPLKPREIIAVVGHQAEDVTGTVEPLGVKAVIQEPQRGTGHAMLVARRAISSRTKVAIVLPGDAPLIRTETLAALAKAHQETAAAATILSAEIENPAGYGRIVRQDDGSVAAIVEDSALTGEQRSIREINSSIYCFTLEKLWPCLATLKPQNVHKELYLTDAIAALRQKGEKVQAFIASDSDEVLGCNTRADLAAVDAVFRRRKRAAIMDAGVSIELPETVLIDPEVSVGADTRIEPAVQLLGKTRIGAGCTIRTGSVLSDAVLEDNVLVKPYTMITASHLSQGAQAGPYAHLRDGARLEDDARVGNFVEVKKSVLGNGVKSMHLTYLGDARVGSGTNIGAGTITCNYDGVNKNPTTIGKKVFIGSDTALVAPVRVGDGAYVGAGSVITKNVPPDALGLARGQQVNKLGWAAARRRELAAAGKPSKSRARKKSGRSSKSRSPKRKR
ncbi:MAG TPA: bifunctional UDP-N-acetylglucosamine diphosphorylase/glucosamine-1-phosphate N-acetyltransferase GlmU [Candidatus Sulfotelmatobacter sp.]|jgi:bifunctional UDP-N-acetylglucosamine pyrophosphorylase / glucosamine-1-phosphate N-acetyltransferase|nr:bifunctional UDP-N-acetylglucosamine diphosphorylase/glucosamine-1-phosphate N-acetyltransferase GlmU [Candidatus Sulfotelmatobacter sp.]